METARHQQQMSLLLETIHLWLAQRPDGYAGGNMFVHFSMQQLRNPMFREPDFLLQLSLVRWQGVFQEVDATWLRWARLDGTLLPTQSELAKEAEQRAQDAEAEVARLKALLSDS